VILIVKVGLWFVVIIVDQTQYLGDYMVTICSSDFSFEYYRQQGSSLNKTDTCVKITHIPSTAIGCSEKHRFRSLNRRAALRELLGSDLFVKWLSTYVISGIK
jgi:protein subunit release factor B